MESTEKPSKTAELVAAVRAYHLKCARPPIFIDQFATALCGKFLHTVVSNRLLAWFMVDILLRTLKPLIMAPIVRARFCEDRVEQLTAEGIQQYVIIGAGYDSFAMRRTDLANKLTVLELDQTATQQEKRLRMKESGIPEPENVRFISADLNKGDMFEVLVQSGFDASKPAIFSWFGVTYYLPLDTVKETLLKVAENAAPGSECLFDYLTKLSSTPEQWQKIQTKLADSVAAKGEPLITGLDPDQVEPFVRECGFVEVENPQISEIEKRYFSDRADNLIFPPMFRLCRACVQCKKSLS